MTEGTELCVQDVSSDGTMLVARVGRFDSSRGFDLVRVSFEDGTVEPLISSPFNELNAALSPDGNWIAYQSDESGQHEILNWFMVLTLQFQPSM